MRVDPRETRRLQEDSPTNDGASTRSSTSIAPREDGRMAQIHDTTMSPTKLQLLSTWLPKQDWYAG